MSETSDAIQRENDAWKIGSHQFPFHNESLSGMWLNLMEFEYKRPTSSAAPTPKATGTEISLPIPMNLGASYGVEWNESERSAFTQQVLRHMGGSKEDIIKTALDNPFAALSKAVKDGKAQGAVTGALADMVRAFGAGGFAVDAANAIASDFLAESSIGKTLGSEIGVARNPWVAQIFTGVSFRSWKFDYAFFPNSKEESDALERIISLMKYGMHPDYLSSANNSLFKYPNMYLPMISPNKYLFEFGFCVIKDLDVQYHGEGSPVYHSVDGDKIPASIKLGFTLQEIDIVTKSNLSPGTSVGAQSKISDLPSAQNAPGRNTQTTFDIFRGVAGRGR